jgi:hypothetical protein
MGAWVLINGTWYYFVENVAVWLNSQAGWSANVADNTRRASTLALPNGKGAPFSAQNVKNVTLSLATCVDLHGDFFQQRFSGVTENCIIAFNGGAGMRGQNLFFSATPGPCNDFFAVNNAFSNVPATTGYAIWTEVSSQCARSTHSHVVFAHNSMPTQRLMLRADDVGYDPDSYCLIANNAFYNIAWIGTPAAKHLELLINNNVIDVGFAEPAGAIGTVIGGDYLTKFADSVNGNFTAAGTLASNAKAPVWSFHPADVMASSGVPAGVLPSG